MNKDKNFVAVDLRLAFRNEGDFVNCYLMPSDGGKHQTLLASVRVSICEQHPDVWNAFKDMMKLAIGQMIESVTGKKPDVMFERQAGDEEGHA